MNIPEKMFIVRKYVMGRNARHALLKERHIKADECWIDEDWKKNQQPQRDAIGFTVDTNEE